jgi:hypothetical protein
LPGAAIQLDGRVASLLAMTLTKMFRRLILEDTAAIYTIAAFITAASIYGAFLWRALRMKPAQVARFENLPFETATPLCGSGFTPDIPRETRRG